MNIGAYIKRLRESHGLTQQQLGEIAGVSDKAISTWELNLKFPRMGALQKIADYFKVELSSFYTDENKPEDIENKIFNLYKSLPHDLQKEALAFLEYLDSKKSNKDN